MSIRRIVAPVVGIVVFVASWEAAVRMLHIRPFVLRAPSQIIAYLGHHPHDFAAASWLTLRHSLIGLLLALAVAVLSGAFQAAMPFLEQATQPVLVLVQVAPFVAYIAPVVLWLGDGTPPVLFIVGLVCLPAFVFATVDGMRSADTAARELLASVDAPRRTVLWRLRLPSAAPALFTAARYNLGLALIAAYLVEGANLTNRGLGAIGKRAAALSVGDALWATVFCMTLLGTATLVVMSMLQRIVLHWHPSQQSPRPASR
ncbi:MAG: ABC transporter permease subunit [Ilumatobacteraceae bacterium]